MYSRRCQAIAIHETEDVMPTLAVSISIVQAILGDRLRACTAAPISKKTMQTKRHTCRINPKTTAVPANLDLSNINVTITATSCHHDSMTTMATMATMAPLTSMTSIIIIITSPNHHIIISSYRHIITASYPENIMSSYHQITKSSYHHIIIPSHHHSIIS